MHGRPRQPFGVEEDPKRVEGRQKKYQQLRQLTDVVLHNAKEKKHSPENLAQSAMLLSKNPEVYTIWNYRREALANVLEGKLGRDEAKEAAAKELEVTRAALMENPKSYTAWHHRLWILKKGLASLDQELEHVNWALKQDSRNFHAWKHRREIVKLSGTDVEDELAYSRRLIEQQPSNYSAWHARSALLTEKYSTQSVVSLDDLLSGPNSGSTDMLVPLDALEEELELAQDAFFTDPEDQSAYIYHRWLVKSLMQHADRDPQCHSKVMVILEAEEKSCQELLELEEDRSKCKWPLQSLAHILRQQKDLGKADVNQEIHSIYQELIVIDPYRAGFYKDALSM